ncbi:MAG: leucine-rich repeat domain-containing protein [Verrucomicrobiota bacterium JB023]|nr:leucine-rich repeat domain-containing protein [Verrucomicrobiota bacterium JB023]
MKRTTPLLLAGLWATFANAAEVSDLTYTDNGSAVTITSCDEAATGALTIPGTLGGLPVTTIASQAFSGCSGLTSIELPSSVTTIENSAFYRCSGLASINLPSGLSSIALSTFSGCSSLSSITIPASVTSIGASAFRECSALTEVVIPVGVTEIANHSFAWCSQLSSVTIPEGVTSLESSCFYNCSSLGSLALPASLESFGSQALYGCRSLSELLLAEGNTSFSLVDGVLFNADGTRLIQYPPALPGASYTVPEGVTEIATWSMSEMQNVTSLTLPSTLEVIGSRALYQNFSLTEVVFTGSVSRIEDAAFFRCYGLDSITLPATLTELGSSVFGQCSSLEEVVFEGDKPTGGEGTDAGFDETGIVAYGWTSGWGATFMGRPVELIGDALDVSIAIVAGVPTLTIDSSPGDVFQIYRSEDGVFGESPLVASLSADGSGSETVWEDSDGLDGAFYRVLRETPTLD